MGKKPEKLFRFPEGTMTYRQWVTRHAVRFETGYPSWESFYNRHKFNRMEHDGEQDAYIARLKKRAEKLEYRAYRADGSYTILPKATYAWAIRQGGK
jgi:hypothetical protein